MSVVQRAAAPPCLRKAGKEAAEAAGRRGGREALEASAREAIEATTRSTGNQLSDDIIREANKAAYDAADSGGTSKCWLSVMLFARTSSWMICCPKVSTVKLSKRSVGKRRRSTC